METVKKYLKEIIIGILVLSILLVSKCTNDSQNVLQGERNALKEQLVKSNKGLVVFRDRQKIVFDSIFLAEKTKNKEIEQLNLNNKLLEESLSKSKKDLQDKKDSYKNKSYEQLAEIFKQLGYKDVSANTTSVQLQREAPMAVLDDLAEGINCFEDLKTKDKIITNKDQEIKFGNEKIANRDFMLLSKQGEIEKIDLSLKLSEELNLKSDKQIRKLKTRNFLNRILLPVALIGGGFIGVQIAK